MNKIVMLGASFLVLLMSSSMAGPQNNINKAETNDIFSDWNENEVKAYYNSMTNGLKGDDLLSSLQTVLKNGHQEVSSTKGGTSWDYYVLLDRDWEKDPLTSTEQTSQQWKTDNVICAPLYDNSFTFIKDNKPGNYNINREHVYPKSYGFGNTESSSFKPYAATDMHNLHMGEKKNNENGHNNYAFGNVSDKESANKITSSISNTVTGYLGKNNAGILVYEPLEKDKGDIARSIFYMAARYHTYEEANNSPSLKLSNNPCKDVYEGSKKTYTAIESKTKVIEYGVLSDLLDWNVLDPVDDHEIHRNNLVYNCVQSNRNPFIDYPSWAEIAYGNSGDGIDLAVAPKLIGSQSEITTYTVNIKFNDDSIKPITGTYKAGDVITLSEPTKDGFTFEGFYKDAQYKLSQSKTITVDSNINTTIFVKWSENIIDINLNGLLTKPIFWICVVLIIVVIVFAIFGSKKQKKKVKKAVKTSNKVYKENQKKKKK